MRKLVLALAAIVSVGCHGSTSPASTVTVAAAASASSLRIGTPLPITVTISNHGDGAIQLSLSPCDRPYEVLDLHGRVVGPAPVEVCALALTAPLIVEPGASVDYETVWSGDAGFGPADEPLFVAPGTYRIRPRVLVGNNTFVYGETISISVTAAQ